MSRFVSFMRFWQCLVFVANCLFKSSDDISKRGHWSKKCFFFPSLSVVGFSPDSFRVEPISQKPVHCVLILFDHKGLPDFKLLHTDISGSLWGEYDSVPPPQRQCKTSWQSIWLKVKRNLVFHMDLVPICSCSRFKSINPWQASVVVRSF